GTGSVIRPGDVQRMSAGTGISHSEFNPSPAEETHLLQIWLLPREQGLAPSYEQRHFSAPAGESLLLVAARDGRDGAVAIRQDADVYVAWLGENESVTHRLTRSGHAWVQVARGVVVAEGTRLEAGDGAAVSEVGMLTLAGVEPA